LVKTEICTNIKQASLKQKIHFFVCIQLGFSIRCLENL